MRTPSESWAVGSMERGLALNCFIIAPSEFHIDVLEFKSQVTEVSANTKNQFQELLLGAFEHQFAVFSLLPQILPK